jgi:poly(ribitol-phosphate) beta-N-acetylglucosaminyltransferase
MIESGERVENASPDVTVIVAVYNVMPYLTRCLTSLVEQSIGHDRMEIIAVDDGSTDGGGEELDRFAERYPDVITVLHQPNSGGPAAPSNRALDAATGRYVYFVGADDYLGAEALERLVTAADEYDSDVVVGKMVGVNDRFVHQGLFERTEPDVRIADSSLPWSLSNCKLFRRELVERHGLRFPENLPLGSDQPFTIEACVRARRISALADYEYYYAVRRTDSSNMTYRTHPRVYLECVEKLIQSTIRLIEPGPDRDAILRRQFMWEVAKHVGTRFLDYDPADRREICAEVGHLCDAYLTDEVRQKIDVKRRVQLSLAKAGAIDTLCAAIRQDIEKEVTPIVLDGGRAFFRYPGLGDEGVPDDAYRLFGNLAKRLAAKVETGSVTWETDSRRTTGLSVGIRMAYVGPGALDPAVIGVVTVPNGKATGPRRLAEGHEAVSTVERVTLRAADDGSGTDVTAWVPVTSLLAHSPSGVRKHAVRLHVRLGEEIYEIPLPAAAGEPPRLRRSYRARPYSISVTAGKQGRLMVTISPTRPLRAVRKRLQRLARVRS